MKDNRARAVANSSEARNGREGGLEVSERRKTRKNYIEMIKEEIGEEGSMGKGERGEEMKDEDQWPTAPAKAGEDKNAKINHLTHNATEL